MHSQVGTRSVGLSSRKGNRMTDRKARRAALAVVPNTTPEVGPSVSFCSHCAARPAVREPGSRVCFSCGLGLLLEAPSEVVPRPGDPFLVLDAALSVCAVSAAAERAAGDFRDRRRQPSRHRVAGARRRRDPELEQPCGGGHLGRARRRPDPARCRPPGQHLRSPADRADHELRAADGGADRLRLNRAATAALIIFD